MLVINIYMLLKVCISAQYMLIAPWFASGYQRVNYVIDDGKTHHQFAFFLQTYANNRHNTCFRDAMITAYRPTARNDGEMKCRKYNDK